MDRMARWAEKQKAFHVVQCGEHEEKHWHIIVACDSSQVIGSLIAWLTTATPRRALLILAQKLIFHSYKNSQRKLIAQQVDILVTNFFAFYFVKKTYKCDFSWQFAGTYYMVEFFFSRFVGISERTFFLFP